MRSSSILLVAFIGIVACPLSAQTIVTLTPFADCSVGYHDNYNSANTNYESSSHYSGFAQPGYAGGVNSGRGLMAFDFSSIPPNSNILAAFLHLTAIGPFGATGEVSTVGHIGDNTCTLQRITQPWDETTVTWNTQPSTTNVNEVVLPQSTYATQNYLGINVTQLVQDMIDDPANSHGFELALVNETVTRGMAFHSTEGDHPDLWPLLTIVYGECDGAVGMVPASEPVPQFSVVPSVVGVGEMIRLQWGEQGSKSATVDLTDERGRLIMSITAGSWPMTMIVPPIASGVYTLVVRDGGSSRSSHAILVVR